MRRKSGIPRAKPKVPPTADALRAAANEGWTCGVCGGQAVEAKGYTRMDPRYSIGSCSEHVNVGITRIMPRRESPGAVEGVA